MRPNEDLFRLIKSMSREERGYFSKYADVHAKRGENNYKRLFSLICGMDDPTDEKIRKTLVGDPLAGYISTAKNQLYFIILRTLRYGARDLGFAQKTSELLGEYDVLASKGLRQQMQKGIRRLEEHTLSNELVLPALEMTDRSFELFMDESKGPAELEKKMETLFCLRERLVMELMEQHRLERWLVKLEVAIGQRNVSSAKKEGGIRQILHFLEEEDERKPTTRAGRFLLAFIQARAMESLSQWKDAFRLYSVAISEFAGSSDQSGRYPMRYIKCFEGRARAAVYMGDKKELTCQINALKRLPIYHPIFTSHRFQQEIAQCIHSIELEMFVAWGELRKGLELVNYLVREIDSEDWCIPLHQKMEMLVRMSTVLFCAGQFRQALHLLNKVYSERFETLDRSLVAFCRVYYLIVHMELGNWDHVYYAFRSILRRMEREGSLGLTEKLVMGYIRSKVFKGKGSPRSFDMERFSLELLWLRNDSGEAGAFRYFDYSCWAEALEKGCTMQQIIDRRRKSQQPVTKLAIPA